VRDFNAGSSLMDARAQAPPKTSVHPLVEDLPPKREKPAMTADERLKVQKELIAARYRQAPHGKAKGGAKRAQPVKPRGRGGQTVRWRGSTGYMTARTSRTHRGLRKVVADQRARRKNVTFIMLRGPAP